MSTEEILIMFQDYFSIKEIFNVPFTYLGELLLRLSYSIASVAENLVSQVYRISDFYSTGEVGDFYNVILAVSWGFLAIVVAWIGIKKISGIPVPNQTIFRNIVLALLFVIILPDMMMKFDDLATIGKQGVSEISSDESESDSLAMLAISDNVTDLLILDNNGFEGTASDNYGINNITDENFKYTDFQEAITADQDGINQKEVFENRITVTEDGNTEVEELESGWLSWDQTYYRYSIDYVTVIIQLLILSVVYIFFAFKIVQISFELAVTKIISPILIFTDIGTGQKMKQIFREVVNGFATLAIIFFLLRLYQIMVSWISTPNVIVPGEMNPLLKALILLILGLVVIDGTSVITRLLGFDVGVKDGFKTMAGMYAGAKGVSAISKSVGSSINNGVSSISSKMKNDTKKDGEDSSTGVATNDKNAESSTKPTGDTNNGTGINGEKNNTSLPSTSAKNGNGVALGNEINGNGVAETDGTADTSSMDSESSIDQNPVTGQQFDLDPSNSKSNIGNQSSLESSEPPINSDSKNAVTGQQYGISSNSSSGSINSDSGATSNIQSDESMSSLEGLEPPQTGDLQGMGETGSQIPLSGQQLNYNSNESGSMTEQENQVSGTATKQQGVNQSTTGTISTDIQGQTSQGGSNITKESGSGITDTSNSSPIAISGLEDTTGSYETTNQEYSSNTQSNGTRENTISGSNTETQSINESTNGTIRNEVRSNTENGATNINSTESFSNSGSSSREIPKTSSSDFDLGSNTGQTTTFNNSESSSSHSTNNVVGTNNKEKIDNIDTNYSVSNQTSTKLNETMKEFSSNINRDHSKPKKSKRPTLPQNSFKSE